MLQVNLFNNNIYSPSTLLKRLNENGNVAFQRFSYLIGTYGENNVYCFVEGHDTPYYLPRVESIVSGKKASFIDSGGKHNVVELHDLIISRDFFKRYSILYFVDRDYDNNDNLSNDIYVTPGYSVENFYASDDAFLKLLSSVYQTQIENIKYRNFTSYLKQEKIKFIDAVSLFCCWYYCIKNKGYKAELGETFPSKYATFDEEIESHYTLEDIKNDYPDIPFSKTEIESCRTKLGCEIENIRGKYVFDFVEYIIRVLNKDSKGQKNYTETKIQLEQNRKTLIERLSCFADTPDTLHNYILRMTA